MCIRLRHTWVDVVRALRQAAGWFTLAIVSCVIAHSSFAQSIDRPLAQLQRTRWAEEQGLAVSALQRVRRTPDGYLWIGSADGLVRFDGVRFVIIDSAETSAMGNSVQRKPLNPLLVDSSGALWISSAGGGLIKYVNGKFTTALAQSAHEITDIVQDGAARFWVLDGGHVHAFTRGALASPAIAAPDTGVLGIVRDGAMGLWIGTSTQGLWHVDGHGSQHHLEASKSIRPLLESRDGTLWANVDGGLARIRDDHTQIVRLPDTGAFILPTSAVESADGSIVISTRGSGVLRWKNGIIDRLTDRRGPSDMTVRCAMIDYEGILWLATETGLERLLAATFTTFGYDEGLPFASPGGIDLDADGGLWVARSALVGTVYKLDVNHLLTAGLHVSDSVSAPTGSYYTPFAAMPDGEVFNMSSSRLIAVRRATNTAVAVDAQRKSARLGYGDRKGNLWISSFSDFGFIRNGHYTAVQLPGAETRFVDSMTEDAYGNMWVTVSDSAFVFELNADGVLRRVGAEAGLVEPMYAIAAAKGDTMWAVGSASGELVRIAGGHATRFSHATLRRILGGTAPALVVDEQRVWFASQRGIGSASTRGLADYSAATAPSPIEVRTYNALDGIRAAKIVGVVRRATVVDRAGRIWYSTPAGLSVVDPRAVMTNTIAPRVHIEEIMASGTRVVADVRGLLNVWSTDRLEIHYSTTALRVPERVRMQYQLSGADEMWVDGNSGRVATYTRLKPGQYEFRVRAWNEDGVAGENVAAVTFSVKPRWYQTTWFVAFILIAVAGGAASVALLLERVRTRIRENSMRARFDATIEERNRLAREVHDTVLSGFAGITFQLQAVQHSIARSPGRAADSLAQILVSADAVLRDARLTVWDLRNAVPDDDLVSQLERVAKAEVMNTPMEVRVSVSGIAQTLAPLVETTLLRVGREAIHNAVQHADAKLVTMKLNYVTRGVELLVSDDGKGFDIAVANAAELAGHWGISGMKERAVRAGGSCEVVSSAGSGTVVHLRLPV